MKSRIINWVIWLFWTFFYLPIATLWKFYKHHPDKSPACVLVLFSIFILIAHFLIPGNQPFEANLLVSHIQFTAPKPNSHLFLQNIDNLTSFDLQTPSETLTLTGKFNFISPDNLKSKYHPILSQKTELSFTFSQANSRLLFYSLKPQSLAISELILNSIVQVHLSYLPYPPETQLKLGLNVPDSNSTKSLATLQLKLKPEPLILVLENVKIEGLESEITELQFTPNAPLNLQLSLISPTQLTLNFAEKTQPKQEWFRGNLLVTDVNLKWVEETGDIRNDFPLSSILKGEVRMNEKTLTIQENQFLLTANNNDIEKLRYFSLTSEPSSVGVQVRLAGKSQQLGVGLDPDYPVQILKFSWLSRYLTPDLITAALSFCAAVIGFLLPYLFK